MKLLKDGKDISVSVENITPFGIWLLYTATLIAAKGVIPAKAGIQENTGFPRIKYGASLVKPGMTKCIKLMSSCIAKEKEYFLSYKDFPYFKDRTLNSIQNVQLLHGYHLYWPDLDIDLEIDNLENPEKYPLKSKSKTIPKSHSPRRPIARR